jgi:type I restriction enzyme, S subunit
VTQWETIPFGECIESIRSGVSLTADARIPRGDEVGILTLGAVSGGRFDPDACKAAPMSLIPRLGKPVRAGTVLMSRSNTIDLVGSAVLVEDDHPDRFLPDLIWEIRLRNDSPLTPRFLTDLLGTPVGRKLLQSAAMGTSGSMKKLSMARVRRLELPLVARHVQRAWETIHRKLETSRAVEDTLIAAKSQLKRGLMQQMLTGKLRFSQFTAADWPVRALAEVVAINPEALSNRTDPNYSFRYIDLSSVDSGHVDRTLQEVTYADAPSRARRVVRQFDVLFATVRPYLKGFAWVQDDERDLVCSTGFAVLRAQHKEDAEYVFEFLFSDGLAQQAQARLVGSSYPALTEADVASFRIPWPAAKERAAIGKTLGRLTREISLLAEISRKHELQKRALMQKLLAGEIDIREDFTDRGGEDA